MTTRTLSFFFLQQFVLLLEDEQIVLLHSIQLIIVDIPHQFYLRVRSFSDLLDLQILVQQFSLNGVGITSFVSLRLTILVS